ncbi:MAG: gliding motility-associated ABC transporter ATP-binding subunit GldA [Bacteroidota bacterium]
MSIVTEGVIKFYGKQKALDQISFSLESGEIVGFIGPNGAGKSTMMRILTGLLMPDAGKVVVNGYDMIQNPVEVRKNIGFLPENNPLYTDMYVREYLSFVASFYAGIQPESRVEKMIEITGLKPEAHKKIRQLSKGYKQRVGIAQALIHDPEVLILDEPTSGLDPNQILEIRDLISGLGKAKTVLLSTHIMQEVEAICDRIMVIKNGRLVANEKKEGIYSHGNPQEVTVLVEFDQPVDGEDLDQLPGVGKIKALSERKWLIEAAGSDDIREIVFKFAVARERMVLSMQKQEKSLEHVFKELTS